MRAIWTKPVSGPKAWRGGDLATATSWVVTLGPGEIADIDRALAVARSSGRSLTAVEPGDFPLERMRSTLERALDEIYDGRGFVVVRGLPAARYTEEDLGTIFWGLGRYLGTPLYQNPQGELLGHVYDHGRTYGNIDVRGYESNAYLPYHTDNCDLVGLLCARRAREGGLSSLVSAVTVHNEILATHPEYLGLLYNGFYYIRREEALTNNGVSERPIPVFGVHGGVLSCRYIRNQINAGAVKRGVPLTTIEKAALDYLDEVTRRPDLRLDMDLEPGDIQLCNNYTILHSRTEFRDGAQPHEKRLMLRLWLKFPKRWPLDAEFPEQVGYKHVPHSKALIEA